jgi:hypothetical protein
MHHLPNAGRIFCENAEQADAGLTYVSQLIPR